MKRLPRIIGLVFCVGITLLVCKIYVRPVYEDQRQRPSTAKAPKSKENPLVLSGKYDVYDPMAIQETVPFLDDFRNPCFLQELTSWDPYSGVSHDHRLKHVNIERVRDIYTKRMQMEHPFRTRCFPSFFIAGVQKCGTTDLQYMVSLHRQVANFTIKENHWWNRGRFRSAVTEVPVTMEGYLDLFDFSAELIYSKVETTSTGEKFHPLILGDTSPALFWDQGFWKKMPQNRNQTEPVITVAHTLQHVLPQAKFVIILRNPTDRLYSDWQMFGNIRFLGSLSPTRFHEKVLEAVNWFDGCTLHRPVRSCFYDALDEDPMKANQLRERHPWWNPVFRLRMGMYYIFIKDLLDVFPRDQVFIFRLEDYSKDRLRYLQDIYTFLELDPDPDLSQKVKYQTVRNQAKRTKPPMLPETWELLNDFYGEYNQKLTELLQDDAFLWT